VFTGAEGVLGALMRGSGGGGGAIGSVPNTEERIAARACSAAVLVAVGCIGAADAD
jgi:hypothetical protein